MSLTGIPLIGLAVLGTLAALAATVLLWHRGRRVRFLVRPAGVLLIEALLLVSVGLVVNRSQQFYPTWAALLRTPSDAGTTFATTPAGLDRWLLARARADPGQSVVFTWRPPGWTRWHLAGAPTVVTPAGYLRPPYRRFPVLLAVDNGTGGWSPAAGQGIGGVVIVFARTTRATTATTLATALPAALGRDLRVTGRRWALIAGAGAGGLAGQVVARFPAIAFMPGSVRPHLPAGVAVDVAHGLRAALIWACGQTPPPLAASTPAVTHLPVHHRSPHPGGSRGPRQPRR